MHIFALDVCKTIDKVRVSKRGQITIPKKLRERFGLNHNVEVELVPTSKGLLLQKQSTGSHPVEGLVGSLTNFEWESTDDFIEDIQGSR